MTNVLIVEDSRIARASLEEHMNASGKYRIIASIENAANAELACIRGDIDLILMDVVTADDESGLMAAAKIKKHYPNIKIIIMTSMPEYSFLQRAKDYGCDGFWYKEYGDTDLLELCDRVMENKTVFPAETPTLQVGYVNSKEFTERELDVIKELVLGSKYEEIADNLGITTNTVKYHIKNILQKTGYHNTTQLVAEVVGKRLILPNY